MEALGGGGSRGLVAPDLLKLLNNHQIPLARQENVVWGEKSDKRLEEVVVLNSFCLHPRAPEWLSKFDNLVKAQLVNGACDTIGDSLLED